MFYMLQRGSQRGLLKKYLNKGIHYKFNSLHIVGGIFGTL